MKDYVVMLLSNKKETSQLKIIRILIIDIKFSSILSKKPTIMSRLFT